MKYLFIYFVKFYRAIVSPMMPSVCRFHPTCSCYMHEALEKHGAFKGLFLGTKRILKCHPYYKGDFYDPVPDHKAET